MRFGRQADLARKLGISRSAVSQAFKKHNIQLSVDGTFDLDYAAWLLETKQNQLRSSSQRSAQKQPPGVKNPRVRREVVRRLNQIWEAAILLTLKDRAEVSFEDKTDLDELISWLIVMDLFWRNFHNLCENEFPSELTDFEYEKPDILELDTGYAQGKNVFINLIKTLTEDDCLFNDSFIEGKNDT